MLLRMNATWQTINDVTQHRKLYRNLYRPQCLVYSLNWTQLLS